MRPDRIGFRGLWAVCVIVFFAFAGWPAAVAAQARAAGDAEPKASILGAIADSMKLVGWEHGIRLSLQRGTRDALREGSFWKDYRRSLKIPTQWEDGDSWLVNYIGHPIHGAAAGYLWMGHDPRTANAEFGLNGRYWATRWRPLTWSAVYSVQFEFGPLSEASIGNVGLDRTTSGWVDHVVTPVAGLGLMIAEDALDQFFVRWFEARVKNRIARGAIRCVFNPARTMANAASGKLPWHRSTRPITAR
jgi:hypothetical protein